MSASMNGHKTVPKSAVLENLKSIHNNLSLHVYNNKNIRPKNVFLETLTIIPVCMYTIIKKKTKKCILRKYEYPQQ